MWVGVNCERVFKNKILNLKNIQNLILQNFIDIHTNRNKLHIIRH